jgi:hypothetical protein
VVVPASDVDPARRFYREQVDFAVDFDRRENEMRAVQVTPPGSAHSISIGTGLVKQVAAACSQRRNGTAESLLLLF